VTFWATNFRLNGHVPPFVGSTGNWRHQRHQCHPPFGSPPATNIPNTRNVFKNTSFVIPVDGATPLSQNLRATSGKTLPPLSQSLKQVQGQRQKRPSLVR